MNHSNPRLSRLAAFAAALAFWAATGENQAAGPDAAPAASPARITFSFNQNWEFFRPDAAKPFVPDQEKCIIKGTFPNDSAVQTVTFPPRTARVICLESDSAHSGNGSAIAEFDLLDAQKQPLPRSTWKIAFVSSQEDSTNDRAEAAIDGKPDTKWHTAWKLKSEPHPHCFIVDLGQSTGFSGFRYLPRQDGNPFGKVKAWKFYASDQAFAVPAQKQADPLTEKVAWTPVTLPHSVRLEPLNAGGGQNYQGVCWYRKTFSADAAWQGKKIYLEFEGAMQVAELWLNNQKLPTHFGGYQPFTLDLSNLIQLGKSNTLIVKLDNSDTPEVPPGKPQNTLDFTYFGGLYRDVRLEVLNPLHITDEILTNKVGGGGIFVTCPEVSAGKARVRVQTDIINESPAPRPFQIRQELLDASGTVVATTVQDVRLAANASQPFTQSLTVTQPRLWHPEHPDLYTLRTAILADGRCIDARTTRVGIRHIEFKPEGLFINGAKFFAQGFNRHQDHPYVGYALSNAQHYRDAKKMRDAGLTSFRSHYPQDPAFMDACDELGILCVVSNPGWQFFGKQIWAERFLQNAREMVRRDRNHPSAIIWEPFPNETQYSEEFARSLHDIVRAEYPGDQCFTAGDPEIGHAKKFVEVAWSREPVPGKPFWCREWGDSVNNWGDQQGRVRVARGWGEVPLITQAVNHAIKLDTMLKTAGGNPAATRMAGSGLWAGIDCYRGYHYQPFFGGCLDLFRIPKFDYYFFQSQRDPAVKTTGVDCGPMVFIANYASPYSPANVTVFSNCSEVRFYENGRCIATQKPDSGYVLDHPPFTFKTKAENAGKCAYPLTYDNAANSEYPYHFQDAEYKAEGLIDGKVVATHLVKAPGVMRKIRLEVDYAGRELTADGGDWIRVYAKICDSRGTVHPFADAPVTFSVEGEGSIIGDASIGANPVKAEAGIATVLVRASGRPGKITVRAAAFGLQPGETVIESVPPALPQR